jgi:TATA-box binding protein (TBP) (component of TFIID and TFIIIB)
MAYKVSTITITASLNVIINLDVFYKNIIIIPHTDISADNSGFTYIEYGKKAELVTYCKGFHKKLTIARRKKKMGKRFDNQATVILRQYIDNKYECANLKIFKNGNVQMTGVKSINHGELILDYLSNTFKTMNYQEEFVENITDINVSNFKIQLINADFKIGYTIKREKLFKLLKTEFIDTFCSFEPCIYPGVKIQFLIKETLKKVTIAVFRSGCVIITGAQALEETDRAFTFINDLLKDRKSEIEMVTSFDQSENVTKVKKKKKQTIIIPEGYVLEI